MAFCRRPDHTPDPLAELKKVNRLLRVGGVVVIKVHNISCLWARLVGKRFYAIIPPFHLFYFNKATLARLLDATGFQMTQSKFIGHRLALKTVPYRLAGGKTNSPWFSLHSLLAKTPFGNVPIYRNLFDIITVIGEKVRDADG